MIICHIITAFGFGGAEKLLVDLVNIQSNKHQVHIVYLKGEPLLQTLLTGPVQLCKIDLDIHCATRLRKFIKTLTPDIIHTHLGHADLIGLWACRNVNVKRFCTMHNIWFKWNWTDHIIFFIYSLLFKTVAKNCKVIAISKSVSEHVENVLKVSKANTKLIHNAIPDIHVKESKDSIRENLNIPLDSFCVLFVGRLELQKSVETLLYAANELKNEIKNIQFLIVGDGTLKGELEDLSRQIAVDEKVFFIGTTKEAEKYFAAVDIFVLPSIFEGFGIVILEAFRASLPVIATNIEGPKELIESEFNGFLFEPKDHKKLADHILQLNRDFELRKEIGDNGYNSYKNKYDIINYEEQIEILYLA